MQDIDFARGRLEVQHTIVEIDGIQLDGVPKVYEARSIPLPPSILAELKILVEGKKPGSPVFAAARGGWLRGRVFRRGLAGRNGSADRPEGPHPARVAAHRREPRDQRRGQRQSRAADARARSAAVTLDVYSDLFDSDLEAVSLALDHAIVESTVAKTLPLDGSSEEKEKRTGL